MVKFVDPTLNRIHDWELVAAEVSKFTTDEIPECIEAIERACRRWLPYDWNRLDSVQGIEQKIVGSVKGRRDCSGIVDLWGWYDRRVQIVDWKTTRSLDDRWVWREERSPQGRWYGVLLASAGLVKMDKDLIVDVEFRGVKNPDGALLKTARQTLTWGDLFDYDKDLSRWEEWYGSLAEDWSWPWPQDRSGCRPFGPQYPCAHEDLCDSGRNGQIKAPVGCDKRMSHSMLKELQRCPERLRLSTIRALEDKDPQDSSEASDFGLAFHAGIAACYKQVFEEKVQK